MGAVQFQQAYLASTVPEKYEIFAHDPNAHGEVSQLVGEEYGLPEPAQVLAARCAGADMSQLRILVG